MRYAEVGDEEEEAVEVVGEDYRAQRAFCDVLVEFSSIYCGDFEIWRRGSCRSEMREGCHVGCGLSYLTGGRGTRPFYRAVQAFHCVAWHD